MFVPDTKMVIYNVKLFLDGFRKLGFLYQVLQWSTEIKMASDKDFAWCGSGKH